MLCAYESGASVDVDIVCLYLQYKLRISIRNERKIVFKQFRLAVWNGSDDAIVSDHRFELI